MILWRASHRKIGESRQAVVSAGLLPLQVRLRQPATPGNSDDSPPLQICRCADGANLRLDSKPVLIFAYVIAAAVVGAFLFLLFREASHDTAQIGARPADRVVLQLQAALQGKGSRSAGIYRARNFAPIWVSDRGLTADARE